MEYAFLFRMRPRGAIGAFDLRTTIAVDANPADALLDVVDRAGAAFALAHPTMEPGGIIMASANGSFLRAALHCVDVPNGFVIAVDDTTP